MCKGIQLDMALGLGPGLLPLSALRNELDVTPRLGSGIGSELDRTPWLGFGVRSGLGLLNESHALCKKAQHDQVLDLGLGLGLVGDESQILCMEGKLDRGSGIGSDGHFQSLCEEGQLDKALGLGLGDELQGQLDKALELGVGDELQSLCKAGQLDKALDVLLQKQHEGALLSEDAFWSLLKACNKKQCLTQAKLLHAYMALQGFVPSSPLAELLVSTYIKCRGFEQAVQVFHILPHRTVSSWTSVLSGYTNSGKGKEALRLYQFMLEEGVEPYEHTFVSLLKACGSIHDLEKGKALHADAQRRGLDTDAFVSSTLISMYGKCGSISDAEIVFSNLPKNAMMSCVLWSAMLSAYVEQGEGEQALRLYRQMREEGVIPNEWAFVASLQACCIIADTEEAAVVGNQSFKVMPLEVGQAIHADAHKNGFVSNDFVVCTLVSMYGKCGSTQSAEDVFSRSYHQSRVTWNAMLSAYVEQGQAENALQIYRQMQEQGVSGDERTFVMALQACSIHAKKEAATFMEGGVIKVMSQAITQALHVDVQMRNFASNVFVDSTLLSLYGKCGMLVEAETIFGGMSHRTVVAWTAMISAYVELGQAEKALRLYQQMQDEGISPNEQTLVMALQACCILGEEEACEVACLDICQALHADGQKKSFSSNLYVCSALVSVYGKCSSIVEAENVFGMLSKRDIATWNSMLSAYVELGDGKQALQLYKKMQDQGACPNERSFVMALQGCSALAEKEAATIVHGQSIKVMSLEIGQALHADAQRADLESHVFVSSSLVSMYGNCGGIFEAEDVFRKMSQRSVVVWNAMLSAYIYQGQGEQALQLYIQMQEEGVTLDDVTLVCVLQASSETGNMEMCRQIHAVIVFAGYDVSPLFATTLIHTYGSCASMEDAQTVFDALPHLDAMPWSALIAGYSQDGNVAASHQNFEKMQQTGIEPDGLTMLSLLSSCSHAGLVDKGIEYFEVMSRDYRLAPEIEHYSCMIDLLGRVGDFRKVGDILSRMSMQPSLAMWLSLLGACRKHGNVELGKHVFDHAVHVQPKQFAAYIVMSNIYADAGLNHWVENIVDVENPRLELDLYYK